MNFGQGAAAPGAASHTLNSSQEAAVWQLRRGALGRVMLHFPADARDGSWELSWASQLSCSQRKVQLLPAHTRTLHVPSLPGFAIAGLSTWDTGCKALLSHGQARPQTPGSGCAGGAVKSCVA